MQKVLLMCNMEIAVHEKSNYKTTLLYLSYFAQMLRFFRVRVLETSLRVATTSTPQSNGRECHYRKMQN